MQPVQVESTITEFERKMALLCESDKMEVVQLQFDTTGDCWPAVACAIELCGLAGGHLPARLLQLERMDAPSAVLDPESASNNDWLGGIQWVGGTVLATWLCRCEHKGYRCRGSVAGCRDWLFQNPKPSVLEIGCGLGLCALVASLRGAEVTATGDTLSHGIQLLSHSSEDSGGQIM